MMRRWAGMVVALAMMLCAVRVTAANSEADGSAIAVVERDGGGSAVVYIEGGAPPRMHVMYELGERPMAWASTPDDIVMVFAATSAEDTASVHPVRRVRMVHDAWDVVSPGELEPLTPIPAFAGRAAVAIAGEDLFVLAGIGESGKKLLHLDGGAWSELAAGTVSAHPWDGVIGWGHAAALTWADGAEVIVQPVGGAQDAGEALRAPCKGPVRVMSVGRQVVAYATPPALAGAPYRGEARLWLVRPGQVVDVAKVPEVLSGSHALQWGDDAILLTAIAPSGTALDVTVVELDGKIGYRGTIGVATLLASAELQVLLLIMVSMGLTVALYVLRRESSVHAPTHFPTGMALADPLRRLMAATMDGSLSIIVIALLWPGDVNVMTAPLQAVVTKLGVWPLVGAMALTALHMGVAEAIAGTTLGKALLGCRTVDRFGRRVGVGRAFARSAAKAACPMLALFVMGSPALPHPGAFGTYTVLRGTGQPRREDAEA
ncbi:MAG: RDD family protein [Phycisphaerales bacterium]|nr:RDD family protein [Phycisphaerales bacterium]